MIVIFVLQNWLCNHSYLKFIMENTSRYYLLLSTEGTIYSIYTQMVKIYRNVMNLGDQLFSDVLHTVTPMLFSLLHHSDISCWVICSDIYPKFLVHCVKTSEQWIFFAHSSVPLGYDCMFGVNVTWEVMRFAISFNNRKQPWTDLSAGNNCCVNWWLV